MSIIESQITGSLTLYSATCWVNNKRQDATMSRYLNRCWNIVSWTQRNNFNEILIQIHTFSFKKIHFKISSGKWWPFCLDLKVLSDAAWCQSWSILVQIMSLPEQVMMSLTEPVLTDHQWGSVAFTSVNFTWKSWDIVDQWNVIESIGFSPFFADLPGWLWYDVGRHEDRPWVRRLRCWQQPKWWCD